MQRRSHSGKGRRCHLSGERTGCSLRDQDCILCGILFKLSRGQIQPHGLKRIFLKP